MAEARRRFSELVDRASRGERFLISRRGRPAVTLVPPKPDTPESPDPPPTGLAAIAGALAEWDELDDVVAEIYECRRTSIGRPVPDLV